MRFQFIRHLLSTSEVVSKGRAWGWRAAGGRVPFAGKSYVCLGERGALGIRAQSLRFVSVDLASDLCHRPASSPVTLTNLDFSAT